MIPIRNGLKLGDVLSPWFFIFALEYAIRRVQGNQGGLKLKDAHQLFVNADDVITREGSVQTIKKNTEAVVVASKATGLAVNADTIKHIQISESERRTKSEYKD
jgi:hypothetical protein